MTDLSRDGRLLAVSRGFSDARSDHEIVTLIDTSVPEVIDEIPVSGFSVKPVFAADPNYLAMIEDVDVLVWDVARRKEVWRLPEKVVHDIQVSANGRWLAAGTGNREAIIWDLATGAELHRVVGHSASVRSVAFSPDNRTLATGGSDGRITLWHVPTFQPLMDLEQLPENCETMQFSSDARYLVCRAEWGQIVCYDAGSGDVIDAE